MTSTAERAIQYQRFRMTALQRPPESGRIAWTNAATGYGRCSCRDHWRWMMTDSDSAPMASTMMTGTQKASVCVHADHGMSPIRTWAEPVPIPRAKPTSESPLFTVGSASIRFGTMSSTPEESQPGSVLTKWCGSISTHGRSCAQVNSGNPQATSTIATTTASSRPVNATRRCSLPSTGFTQITNSSRPPNTDSGRYDRTRYDCPMI